MTPIYPIVKSKSNGVTLDEYPKTQHHHTRQRAAHSLKNGESYKGPKYSKPYQGKGRTERDEPSEERKGGAKQKESTQRIQKQW